MRASGNLAGTTYYFAVKTADEVSNWSGISNCPETGAGPVTPSVAVDFESYTAGEEPADPPWNRATDIEPILFVRNDNGVSGGSMALYDGGNSRYEYRIDAENIIVGARMRWTGGSTAASTYGLVARQVDLTHYYRLVLDKTALTLKLQRYDGTMHDLVTQTLPGGFNCSAYHMLELHLSGPTGPMSPVVVLGYVDGQMLVSYADDDDPVTGSGTCGFFFNDAGGYLDDFRVYSW